MKKEIAFQRLSDCGVVGIIRAQTDIHLERIASALLEGGVIGVEVTMTTPRALRAIEKLTDTFGERMIIGVGTVLDPATCADAIHAGAQFVVSPTTNLAVIETTRRLGKISVPGALTPTEILNAWSAGADVVKVFPVNGLGPSYFRDLLSPLPFLKLVPTGGVDVKLVPEWIKSGACMIGAGATLISKEAQAREDWGSITATARQFVEGVKAGRAS